MNTQDIISHLKFLFDNDYIDNEELCKTLRYTKVVYVTTSNKWCYASEFYDPEVDLFKIKTHGSVSCGPRKRGVRKRSEYIDRNNKVAIFTHP